MEKLSVRLDIAVLEVRTYTGFEIMRVNYSVVRSFSTPSTGDMIAAFTPLYTPLKLIVSVHNYWPEYMLHSYGCMIGTCRAFAFSLAFISSFSFCGRKMIPAHV